MKFIILLLLLGTVLPTHACQVPYNNVNLMGNKTHFSTDLVAVAQLEAQNTATGWAEIVTHLANPHTTWPGGLVTYYYHDPDV
jgi:hypothetical protein